MAFAAASQLKQQLHFGHFEVVELIGRGAYGDVYKAKFLGVEWAMKRVHTAPFSHLVDQTPLKRFEQECQFMNTLKHPNIVQCMGIITSDCPILVMELMNCNLNKYLEDNKNMSFHIEFSIADDVINGIRFLHQQKIVHRDISGANILMAGSKAKISDLGMAKLMSAFQPNQLTPCPGNRVYMPFIAILENPSYNEKIDIYSYGVVLIQIVTKKYPNPSNQCREENGRKIIPTEHERRHNHIVEIHDNHPMKRIALSCLHDNQDMRPSAIDVQRNMDAIKESEVYISSLLKCERSSQIVKQVDIVQLYQEHQLLLATKAAQEGQIQNLLATNASQEGQIQQLQQKIGGLELGMEQLEQRFSDRLSEEKTLMERKSEEDRQVIYAHFQKLLENAVQQLQQEALDNIREKESQCVLAIEQAHKDVAVAQEKEAQAAKTAQENQALAVKTAQENQQLVYQIEENYRRCEERSNSFTSSVSTSLSETQLSVSRNSTGSVLVFDIDNCSAPTRLHKDSAAVVHNKAIYVRPGRTKHIHRYFNGQWFSSYLECKVDNCSLAIVLDSLVSIGGRQTGKNDINVVGTLYRCTDTNEWINDLPPMPTARELPLVVTSGKTLIAASGRDKQKVQMVIVEVFHEDTQQWQTACSLPFPLYFASITTFDESLIIHGMKQRSSEEPVQSISCKLTDLICSCVGNTNAVDIWNHQALEVPPKSSLVKFNHHLLAVGGQLQDGLTTGAVFSYSLELDEWIEMTSLNIPRFHCFTAVMSECLYIIGGDEGSNNLTNSVEKGIYQ